MSILFTATYIIHRYKEDNGKFSFEFLDSSGVCDDWQYDLSEDLGQYMPIYEQACLEINDIYKDGDDNIYHAYITGHLWWTTDYWGETDVHYEFEELIIDDITKEYNGISEQEEMVGFE